MSVGGNLRHWRVGRLVLIRQRRTYRAFGVTMRKGWRLWWMR